MLAYALYKIASPEYLNIANDLLDRGIVAEHVAAFRRIIEFGICWIASAGWYKFHNDD